MITLHYQIYQQVYSKFPCKILYENHKVVTEKTSSLIIKTKKDVNRASIGDALLRLPFHHLKKDINMCKQTRKIV